jgi:hypothetical protein
MKFKGISKTFNVQIEQRFLFGTYYGCAEYFFSFYF